LTRRRQDPPDLPRRKVTLRTIGKKYNSTDGKTFCPSMSITLTCPGYGRVREDGTPAHAATYHYLRAARDALHFAALFDRFVEAGRRVVPIPAMIIPVIRWHLACFAQDGDEGLVFTSPRSMPLRHSQFRQRVWLPALKSAGLAEVHFHDLQHPGNTLAASAGANLRELMDRNSSAAPGARPPGRVGADRARNGHASAARLPDGGRQAGGNGC
jgi:hypothetical protein